jgi:hypothetical protein
MRWGSPCAPGSTVRNRTTVAALKVNSVQLDLNRIGARPPALQFPHESLRDQRLFARVGPTSGACRITSDDPPEARRRTTLLTCTGRLGGYELPEALERRVPGAAHGSALRLSQSSKRVGPMRGLSPGVRL